MALLRLPALLRQPLAATTPVLIEGELPYADIMGRYMYQTGNIGNDALRLAHDGLYGETDPEPIPSYRVNFEGTGYDQVRNFPRGWFLDQLWAYDGAGQPVAGQEPTIWIKPWNGPEVLLATFLGTKYFGGPAGWWKYSTSERIEIQWHRTHSPTASNIFPTEYRYFGGYPDNYLTTYNNVAVPVARLEDQGDINTFKHNLNHGTNGPLVRNFGKGERVYLDNNEILSGGSTVDFASWDAALLPSKNAGRRTILCFNGNSADNILSFVNGGYTPEAPLDESAAEIGRNSYHAYGADRTNPATYLWVANYGKAAAAHFLSTGVGDVLMWGNEMRKDWKTRQGYNSIKNCALQLSMWWNGCNGLYPNTGVKAGNPNARVGIGYAFGTDAGQIIELDYWLGEIYGRDANGYSLWFPHVIEGHDYLRDPVTGQGIFIERSEQVRQLRDCIAILARMHPTTQYWQTEDGYTGSPLAEGLVPVTSDYPDGHAAKYSYIDAANGLSAGLRRWAATFGGMLRKTYLGVRRNVPYCDFNLAALVAHIQWDQAAGYISDPSTGQLMESYNAWVSLMPHIIGYTPKGPLVELGSPGAERWIATMEKAGSPDIKFFWATSGVTTPSNLGTGELFRFDAATGELDTRGMTSAPIIPSELPILFIATS